MITIHKSGKITIPQEEGFIGYAGDNLNKTLEFIVEKHTDENCYYRAFLKFDDDTVNYFILNKKIKDGNTILEWTVTQDQLYKNGIVYLQIKAFNISNVIFHTESVPIFVGDSIEFTDYLAERPNSEFLQQEEHLNNLLYNVENAKEFLPYIGENGNWYVYDYDTKSYYDTGVTALGSADKYPLTTEITETSSDDNASSAKAVYNYGQKIYSDAKEHFSTTAGDLAYLNTKDKSSLVNAINELETEKISNTNGSVTTENLSDNSVTTGKIASKAVTGAEIADYSVASRQLANNAVTMAKISSSYIDNEPSISAPFYGECLVKSKGVYNALLNKADYEQKTDCVLTSLDSTTAKSGTFSYARIGNFVFVNAKLVFQAPTSSNYAAKFTGLPFSTNTNYYSGFNLFRTESGSAGKFYFRWNQIILTLDNSKVPVEDETANISFFYMIQ